MSAALEAACALIGEKLFRGPLVVAIEGGAATGKSTLASQLARRFDAPVIPMDDFFLPPDLRTGERLAERGGNIHYERFDLQVAQPLREHRTAVYDVYDCHADRIIGQRRVEPGPLTIVEGVYSLHPRYRDVMNLRILLQTSPETQDKRLRARGPWLYRSFRDVWLPLERAYFEAEDFPALCDAVLAT